MSMISTYHSSLSETLSQFQKHLCWEGEEDGQMEDRQSLPDLVSPRP